MIKAVFFDLDNTLIDFMAMKKKACRAAIRAMIKAGLKSDEVTAWGVMKDMFREHGIEDQRLLDNFLKKTEGKVDIRKLAAGVVAYRRAKKESLKPYPNTRRVLAALSKKYRLAIVTDAPGFQAWTRLYESGLQDYFDFVIALEDTGVLKSEKLPFTKALKGIGLKPEEVVMVGDSIERDILPAEEMGMSAVHAEYGNWSDDGRTAKNSIKGIGELPAILERLNGLNL